MSIYDQLIKTMTKFLLKKTVFNSVDEMCGNNVHIWRLLSNNKGLKLLLSNWAGKSHFVEVFDNTEVLCNR